MALIEDDLLGSIKGASGTLLKCMMIVTATEVCGSFLTGKTGNGTTEDNFWAFWKSKYMPVEYYEIIDLLYRILRNGVSHSFVAKGGIIPSSDEAGSHMHLRFLKDGIF